MNDRIEKKRVLRAPRAKVWRAIGDSAEFGKWFGVAFEGPFVAGQTVHGRITNPPEYSHIRWACEVERVEPERLLSFRWHPYGIDPALDPAEPKTLVEFTLQDADGGTLLTIVESGFDRVSPARRAKAFQMNDQGWGIQIERIAGHVES